MKKRNLGIMVLLSIVTLGIYLIVWTYKTRKEMVERLQDPKAIPPFWYLFAPLIILIVDIIIFFFLADSYNGQVEGVAVYVGGLIGIICSIALLVIPFFWYYRYFKALHRISAHSDPVLLYVFWVISMVVGLPFWVLLTQNEINKVIDGASQLPQPSGTSGTPPPVTPATPSGL